MAEKYPRVSVVMSNYNGVMLGLLDRSLSSILSNTYPNLEVLLVDNASTDGSVEFVNKKFRRSKKLKLIQNPVNMYSAGLNLGIKNSTGKYVAFFNNDAFVENGYFEKFIPFLEKNVDIVLSQGKLLSSSDHSKIDSVGETMDIFGNPKSIGHGEKDGDRFNSVVEVLSVSGSCSILRRSAVKEIGYFDEKYGIGYEDMDLALRAWMQGFKAVYFPGVKVFHKRGSTDLSPIVRVKVKWHFNKNRITTLLKNFELKDLALSLPTILVFYTLAGLWEIFAKGDTKLGLTRFTSIMWVFTNLPGILSERKKVKSSRKAGSIEKIRSLMLKRI